MAPSPLCRATPRHSGDAPPHCSLRRHSTAASRQSTAVKRDGTAVKHDGTAVAPSQHCPPSAPHCSRSAAALPSEATAEVRRADAQRRRAGAQRPPRPRRARPAPARPSPPPDHHPLIAVPSPPRAPPLSSRASLLSSQVVRWSRPKSRKKEASEDPKAASKEHAIVYCRCCVVRRPAGKDQDQQVRPEPMRAHSSEAPFLFTVLTDSSDSKCTELPRTAIDMAEKTRVEPVVALVSQPPPSAKRPKRARRRRGDARWS